MPTELLDIIKNGGVGLVPVFAFLWWRAEGKLEKLQSKLDDMGERSLSNAIETKNVLSALTQALTSGRRE